MSKYTTEVRFICEEAAGLEHSVGYNDVEEVVQKAYPKIFSDSLVFYNEETKARLLPKILIHYYQREIGFETVGLWKLKLNQKLSEILPYYNQLYASEELNYDPLKNVDNYHDHSGQYADNRGGSSTQIDNKTETRNLKTVDDGMSSFDRNEDTVLRHDKTTTRGNDVRQHADDKIIHGDNKTIREDNKTIRANDSTLRGNDVVQHTITNPTEHWEMFSDTPQGGIDGVQLAGGVGTAGTLSDNAYLTNATHITESPAATQDTTSHGTITNQFGDVTNKFGDITNQFGDVTNQFGNITQQHGDIVESYNKNGDKVDHVDADGWEKTDNTNTHTGTVNNTGSSTNVKDETNTGTDSHSNHEYGKIGVMTYQEMQMKWRESFLNIDMQIIDELGNLFMKVW